MPFGKKCASNLLENNLQSGESLMQQEKMHIWRQLFEHNGKKKKKPFSAKKIFLMFEQVYTQNLCSKQLIMREKKFWL